VLIDYITISVRNCTLISLCGVQVSLVRSVIASVPNTALEATVTEYLATASACPVYSAQRVTDHVLEVLGVQIASICASAPHSNTLPGAIPRTAGVFVSPVTRVIPVNSRVHLVTMATSAARCVAAVMECCVMR